MVPSPPLDYTRYLAAKRTVDDRALHGGVWASAAAAVAAVADATLPPRGEEGGVLRVCDAGAGVGATLVRVRCFEAGCGQAAAWGVLGRSGGGGWLRLAGR